MEARPEVYFDFPDSWGFRTRNDLEAKIESRSRWSKHKIIATTPMVSNKALPLCRKEWLYPGQSTWMQSQKWQNDLCLFPRQTIYYHSNPSLCPNRNAEEAEVERFYEDLQDLLELTTKKRCPFHYSGLECKSRESRCTWSNMQIWPWNMEWSRAKTNRVLPRKCTGHNKHPLPTTEEKTLNTDITRWSIPKTDWLYSL